MALICPGLLCGASVDSQQITISVAPFATTSTEGPYVGIRAGAILNLQIWQTLRIPVGPEGRHTKGTVTWDFASHPPTTFAEAEGYAAAQTDQEPQIVLWGRAWQYGAGTVVEAFLSIRPGNPENPFGANLWTVHLPDDGEFTVGVPHRQIEFAPIVIRSELMPELTAPAGLKLYSQPSGPQTLGFVGDYFKALEQGSDSAKVVTPNGTRGWIRLPNLSTEHSEVVDFSGGVVRILRNDWDGAIQLLRKAAENPRAPTSVRDDSYLYIAIATARSGGDPSPWIQKAYELNPYSRTVLQYLCMAKLALLVHSDVLAANRSAPQIEALRQITAAGGPLYSRDDPWFNNLKSYLDRVRLRSQ
jgi:hypothetical protein